MLSLKLWWPGTKGTNERSGIKKINLSFPNFPYYCAKKYKFYLLLRHLNQTDKQTFINFNYCLNSRRFLTQILLFSFDASSNWFRAIITMNREESSVEN